MTKNLVRHLQDNAMLYKDITQWLRNRTFVALFFGLLLLAEGISVFIMSLGEEVTQPGPDVFYSLYTVLIVYSLIIAFMGHSLTSREFANRTFELFELSGMSLEKMIGGKLLSMMYEFLFGFFCIVPFMFFAYFLGGLDFFELISGAILTLFAFFPLYLIALQLALSTRIKQMSVLARVGGVFLLFFVLVTGITSFFSPYSPIGSLFRSASDVIKGLMTLNISAIGITCIIAAFYIQICLLLFYVCCNTISREADSRELPIKVLFVTLTVSWMAYRVYNLRFGYGSNEPNIACIPVFLALCLFGLLFYFNRYSVPQIVRRKYEKASSFSRGLYYLFQPGMAGTVRTFVLVLVLLAGFSAFMLDRALAIHWTGIGNARESWLQAISLPFQVPFFLVFPLGFLLNVRNIRFNYVAQRTIVAVWWGVAGAVTASLVAWWNLRAGAATATVFELLALFVSPFSSAFGDLQSITYGASWIRIGTGVLGLYIMVRHVMHMRKLQSEGLLPARPVAEQGDSTSASLAA